RSRGRSGRRSGRPRPCGAASSVHLHVAPADVDGQVDVAATGAVIAEVRDLLVLVQAAVVLAEEVQVAALHVDPDGGVDLRRQGDGDVAADPDPDLDRDPLGAELHVGQVQIDVADLGPVFGLDLGHRRRPHVDVVDLPDVVDPVDRGRPG